MFARVFAVAIAAQIMISSGQAGTVDQDLSDLAQIAPLAYMLCSVKADKAQRMFQLTGDKSAWAEVESCANEQQVVVRSYVDRLKPTVVAKPKAEQALKDFYTLWNSKITTIGTQGVDPSAMDAMKQKIETVRTELAW